MDGGQVGVCQHKKPTEESLKGAGNCSVDATGVQDFHVIEATLGTASSEKESQVFNYVFVGTRRRQKEAKHSVRVFLSTGVSPRRAELTTKTLGKASRVFAPLVSCYYLHDSVPRPVVHAGRELATRPAAYAYVCRFSSV